MKKPRRLALWLSLMAVTVPLTIGLILNRGLVLEIKASAATPPLVPETEEIAPAKKIVLSAAGDVLVNGGMGAGKAKFKTIANAEFYNPIKHAFFTTGVMPVTAAAQSAIAVSSSPGAKIAAFGGISGISHATVNLLSFTGIVMAGIETYDSSTGKWTVGATSMSAPRTGATATLLPSGKILIAGGFDSSKVAQKTAEIYDPANGTFVATDNNMTDARAFHTATLLLNGKVLLASGLTDDTGNLSSTADIFDPNAGMNGTFTASASTPGSRAAAASVLFPSGPMVGKVLITGGDVCAGTGDVCSGKTIDVYDPDTDIFSFPTVMNEFRLTHTATLLKNGTVLVAGGIDVDALLQTGTVLGNSALTTFSRSAEIFDPSSGTFACVGGPGPKGVGCKATMTHTRAGHTATLLGDGSVLLAGGFVSYGFAPFQMGAATPSAEIYDPVAQTFKKTGIMHSARGGHTATRIQ